MLFRSPVIDALGVSASPHNPRLISKILESLLRIKETINAAFSVDAVLRSSPSPLAAFAPAPAAAAPYCIDIQQRDAMDIKYGVNRSLVPIKFANGIDPVNAIVGAFTTLRQVLFKLYFYL
jgi:hypothetical protein